MFKDAGKIKNILGIAAAAIGAAFVGMNILAKVKRGKAVYKNEPEQQNPFEGKKVMFNVTDGKQNAIIAHRNIIIRQALCLIDQTETILTKNGPF